MRSSQTSYWKLGSMYLVNYLSIAFQYKQNIQYFSWHEVLISFSFFFCKSVWCCPVGLKLCVPSSGNRKRHNLLCNLLSSSFFMWGAKGEMKHMIFMYLRNCSLHLGCLRFTSHLVYLNSMFTSSNLKRYTKSFYLQSLKDFCLLTKMEGKILQFFWTLSK